MPGHEKTVYVFQPGSGAGTWPRCRCLARRTTKFLNAGVVVAAIVPAGRKGCIPAKGGAKLLSGRIQDPGRIAQEDPWLWPWAQIAGHTRYPETAGLSLTCGRGLGVSWRVGCEVKVPCHEPVTSLRDSGPDTRVTGPLWPLSASWNPCVPLARPRSSLLSAPVPGLSLIADKRLERVPDRGKSGRRRKDLRTRRALLRGE